MQQPRIERQPRFMGRWSPDLPKASIALWPYDYREPRRQTVRTVLDVYLDSPRLIYREARRLNQTYKTVTWDALQEIIDWEANQDGSTDTGGCTEAARTDPQGVRAQA